MRISVFLLVVVASCFASRVKRQENENSISQDEKRKAFVESIGRSNMTVVQEKLKMLRLQSIQQHMIQMRPSSTTAEEASELHPRTQVRKEGDSLLKVNTKANLTDYMYQADILLTEEQVDQIAWNAMNYSRRKRQAYRDSFYPSTIWKGRVHYFFDESATPQVKKVYKMAVDFWKKHTCIKFKYSKTATHRIKVFKGQGCYSYIGKVEGVQELSLGKGCETVGTAAHELGHALGFFHTQSRYDRDESITVKFNNIEAIYVDQFDKEDQSTNDNYGIPYDYGSIMQYGGHSAAKGEEPSMVAREHDYQDTMGSDIVGFYDVLMMNKHYKCTAKCKKNKEAAKCKNGGFPRPRNCKECICPGGYGGKLCQSRPKGCGAVLTAKKQVQELKNTIGDGKDVIRETFQKCHYWIKAPPGKRIEIRVAEMSGFYLDGCIYGGVEIKSQKDQRMTGYRFCSPAAIGKVLTSASNLVPIITFSKYMTTKTVIQYRIADSSSSESDDVWTTTESNTKKAINRPVNVKCEDEIDNCDFVQQPGFCQNVEIRRKCKKSCDAC